MFNTASFFLAGSSFSFRAADSKCGVQELAVVYINHKNTRTARATIDAQLKGCLVSTDLS